MSRDKFLITGRGTLGVEMKKYAKCTMIATMITLILASAVQFLWFKYDSILREGWLRISYAGYTSEEEPWIRFFQSAFIEKIIPVCSLITLAIVLIYLSYDVLRDIHSDEESDEGSFFKRFLSKFTAVGICAAIATAIHTLAGFFGNGCLTYDNGLYLLGERSFLPIGGYTYDEVVTKYPSVNVKIYIFAFLMLMFVFLSLYLFASVVAALANLSKKLANIASLVLLGTVVAVVLMANTSNLVILALVAALIVLDSVFLSFVADRNGNNRQMI